jgi:nucleotide sugar dehydrogenase
MNGALNTVAMIGLGYIGLPTAAMLASRKIKVIGVDINQHAVDTINKGKIHIVEPELDMIVSAAVSQGYLRATTKPEPADAFLIAVPTPFMGDHDPDVRFVEAAAKSIAPVLKKGDLVILESTSPVGTTEQMAEWLAKARSDLSFPQQNGEAADINIAYCPERVLPGRVVHELVNNDRVIGGMTERCSQRAIELYKTFVEAECIKTNARTAEMCKLTENSFRDVNIAFANELSIICDKLSINAWELIRLANRHPRVNILNPGPGVGGHCIAVDPWFIVAKTPSEANLIRTAREVNDINGKMSELNAAFGLLQLKHVDAALARRKEIDLAYREGLNEVKGIVCLNGDAHDATNHSYFPILVQHDYPLSRDALYQKLKDHKIYARRYFYPLISEFPMYRSMLSAQRDNLPVATLAASQVLCLPIYPALDNASISDVISIIKGK